MKFRNGDLQLKLLSEFNFGSYQLSKDGMGGACNMHG